MGCLQGLKKSVIGSDPDNYRENEAIYKRVQKRLPARRQAGSTSLTVTMRCWDRNDSKASPAGRQARYDYKRRVCHW